MFETIDRIFSLDLSDRGVGKLYEPARKAIGEPLCLRAARMCAALSRGDRVFLLTGSLTRNWVSGAIAETDGPIGTAALARNLS